MPDVPFEMLTALPLRAEHWTELVKTMKTPELRAYLATLRSHGIFADPRTVEAVAKELTDACSYRRTRVMPLAVLTTLGNADVQLTPVPILAALAEGLDHAAANVPRVDGRVVVAADVSGSMTASFAGDKLRCVDVAALVAAVLFHRNEGAEVLPFAYDVLDVDLDRRTPAFATLDRLSAVSSGNTRVSAPLERLAGRRDTFDLLVVVSDNRAWTELDFTAWDALRARNPNARLVLVDLRHRGYPEPRAFRPDVLHVSGFSDSVFDVLAAFARGDLDADHLRTIEEVVL